MKTESLRLRSLSWLMQTLRINLVQGSKKVCTLFYPQWSLRNAWPTNLPSHPSKEVCTNLFSQSAQLREEITLPSKNKIHKLKQSTLHKLVESPLDWHLHYPRLSWKDRKSEKKCGILREKLPLVTNNLTNSTKFIQQKILWSSKSISKKGIF